MHVQRRTNGGWVDGRDDGGAKLSAPRRGARALREIKGIRRGVVGANGWMGSGRLWRGPASAVGSSLDQRARKAAVGFLCGGTSYEHWQLHPAAALSNRVCLADQDGNPVGGAGSTANAFIDGKSHRDKFQSQTRSTTENESDRTRAREALI
ncbi:hypothetical protein GP486_003107 [Trichoglossum hirsutum]|uniref:Uncharacterized protein n=1 Tax=Trichoglossum hirsutum TaxID=265104 RepID=A0A9P8LDY5_9PEZI|nr:hypothetical protein GP486_003107 [Trichoglossum hirsutum]